jgi:hypothetical protein
MALTRQEVRLAHFHAVLDRWVGRPAPVVAEPQQHSEREPA